MSTRNKTSLSNTRRWTAKRSNTFKSEMLIFLLLILDAFPRHHTHAKYYSRLYGMLIFVYLKMKLMRQCDIFNAQRVLTKILSGWILNVETAKKWNRNTFKDKIIYWNRLKQIRAIFLLPRVRYSKESNKIDGFLIAIWASSVRRVITERLMWTNLFSKP